MTPPERQVLCSIARGHLLDARSYIELEDAEKAQKQLNALDAILVRLFEDAKLESERH